jgi:formylglycine-generating enzyme required for sulfatase activity
MPPGCARNPQRLRIERTRVKIGPNDWQSEQVPVIDKDVGPLWSDSIEVTNEQWRRCAATNHCKEVPLREPGQPIVNVTLERAQDYCRANGGRLPRLEERMAIAAGTESRRYPWGQTGLVCRRAVFGVSDGPCAEKGTEPDVAGSHVAGQSPQGVLDLAGNVAELAIDEQQRAWVCGGSFRSRSALELKSWACSLFLSVADDVGFRCVYDSPL